MEILKYWFVRIQIGISMWNTNWLSLLNLNLPVPKVEKNVKKKKKGI